MAAPSATDPTLSSRSGEAQLSSQGANPLGSNEFNPTDKPSGCERIGCWVVLNQDKIILVLAVVTTILLLVALGSAFTLAYAPLTLVVATVLTAVAIAATVLAGIALVTLFAVGINKCIWSEKYAL